MSFKRPLRLTEFGRYRFEIGQGFGVHSHEAHQLSWARRGLQEVDARGDRWALPPGQAMWIPGGVVHDVRAGRRSDIVLLYFAAGELPGAWATARASRVLPGLAALVDGLPAVGGVVGAPTEGLDVRLGDLLEPVVAVPTHAPMPLEQPVRQIAEHLRAHPADERSLADWGRVVGASSRTLTRAFQRATGMSFSDWRTQTRLQASLVHLADGAPVTRVAHAVGYASASSFIVAFRRQFGHSPAQHYPAIRSDRRGGAAVATVGWDASAPST